MKTKFLFKSLLVFGLLLTTHLWAQFDIPKKPDLQTSVYDYAQILSPENKSALEQKLIRYADSTSTQIVVITIESLKGEDIGILTPKWGHAWGIGGTQQNDNGVIILLAKAEKKIWISAGYGLEDRLTAGIGGEITRNVIVPEFKKGDFYAGLNKGTDAIIDVFKGKYKADPKHKKHKKSFPVLPIIIFVIILLVIISKSKKGGGGNSGGIGGGTSLMDAIILSSLGRGGFGGGSFGGGSSGGGFGGGGFGGGFGGGGFSGGGSGGSW
ncbi:TPM domain-containing protein [Flavobacterium sp. CYK-55]|uniref:TPM domain-containing protein n=1 Tax=Flavobacterium sp. CYK-55 TaxID=2835529 RepID=UPI001BCFF5CC|nr:TPM domain-containing protein [Flavobacterium sp. CYK-55]MBS7785746.1 TPM domain-containing protein [Flavobacterium sp. CYK-55]